MVRNLILYNARICPYSRIRRKILDLGNLSQWLELLFVRAWLHWPRGDYVVEKSLQYCFLKWCICATLQGMLRVVAPVMCTWIDERSVRFWFVLFFYVLNMCYTSGYVVVSCCTCYVHMDCWGKCRNSVCSGSWSVACVLHYSVDV